MEKLDEKLLNFNVEIDEIVLFKYNVEALRKFSFGTWASRQHIFIAIRSGNCVGYGENIISINTPDISLDEWESWCKELVGFSITDALLKLRTKLGVWFVRFTEMVEMALIDLAGKIGKVSSLTLLNLNERYLVNGVYVILNDDPGFVKDRTVEAVGMGVDNIIKVKLFGDVDVDLKIIRAVRDVVDRRNTYLIGDVNLGYGPKNSKVSIAVVAASLMKLFDAGLDACEDPACLTVDEWVRLQDLVQPFSLIPDEILRPSRDAVGFIKKGMGNIYNIHPGATGSIIDAVSLANKIKDIGAGLMIGDDSLIGPGCTIWQQLAISLNAKWVEAIEKQNDSTEFLTTVISKNTDSSLNPVKYKAVNSGFGLILDLNKLEKLADDVRIIRK